MDSDDPLADAIAEWQRKHRIADGDPMIAALELVRVYLQHARPADDTQIPSFEDFRGTIELLDRRSKSFITQASDLVSELRRFGQNVERLNRVPFRDADFAGLVRNSHWRGGGPLVMSMTVGYAFAAALAGRYLRSSGARSCTSKTASSCSPRRFQMDAGRLLSRLAHHCDTGSGKTRSGITPLLFQIFSNEPTWGGLCIDDKGLYWETLTEMARHFGREDDLILLQVRPDDYAAAAWSPPHLQPHR